MADGYVDRTQNRVSEEDDDKAARIKSLEELLKLQQIDQETFEKLRDEITGGQLESTHLVKGLDFKLLERVRRGEVSLSGETISAQNEEDELDEEDVDEELERMEEREIAPAVKESVVKKGEMAPPSMIPGKKRTRDQILAELKASRKAAAEAAKPSLGAKFKKVGATRSTSRIERDSKGREVLIIIDEDGNEKRKVRRVGDQEAEKANGLLMPDKDAKPLGMVVPERPETPEEEDIDIFDDVGDDYDPLAGLDEDSDAEETKDEGALKDTSESSAKDTASMPPPPRPKQSAPNYFNETKKEEPQESAGAKAMTDPTILAAIKKASMLNLPSDKTSAELAEEKAKEEKRRRMIQLQDRDAEDLDMGFGSSFAEDGEDGEDSRIKLSEWGVDDDEGGRGRGRGGGGGGKSKKGKKRKGDVNSVADVMKAIESRKGEKS